MAFVTIFVLKTIYIGLLLDKVDIFIINIILDQFLN